MCGSRYQTVCDLKPVGAWLARDGITAVCLPNRAA